MVVGVLQSDAMFALEGYEESARVPSVREGVAWRELGCGLLNRSITISPSPTGGIDRMLRDAKVRDCEREEFRCEIEPDDVPEPGFEVARPFNGPGALCKNESDKHRAINSLRESASASSDCGVAALKLRKAERRKDDAV